MSTRGGIASSADQAVAIGLAVSELVDRSFHSAFAGMEEGCVRVSMRSRDGKGFSLEVSDDGNGRGTLDGLGLAVALAERLGGAIEYESAEGIGTKARIVVAG